MRNIIIIISLVVVCVSCIKTHSNHPVSFEQMKGNIVFTKRARPNGYTLLKYYDTKSNKYYYDMIATVLVMKFEKGDTIK